ncbi:MAG TPA: NADH-quinone oxidoreductase subunit J [Candidatus Dormibacteraeota bacterium]
MASIVFYLFGFLALAGGLGVVLFREPIKNVLSLVLVMLSLAVLFLLLSAQFVFAVQVIVYAGAVMVLFLFVVALMGPIHEHGSAWRTAGSGILALVVVAAFAGFLWSMLSSVRYRSPDAGDQSLFGTVQAIGVGLFTTYLYPFELTSILLLVAAVGAIYLSRRPGDEPAPELVEEPARSIEDREVERTGIAAS